MAVKVTIAQLNPIVGDIEGNKNRAKDLLVQASREGSDLLVLPELYLVGYPPKDLLEWPAFIDQSEQALAELQHLTAEHPSTGLLVGAPRRTGDHHGKGLYNSAVLLYQGRLLHSQAKSLLPTYDVFDEARYFDPASSVEIVEFKGERLGLNVCEDAWNDPEAWPGGRLYRFDPPAELAKRGATLLINLSASPFYAGKEELRHRLISGHAKRLGLPFLYVNQVGANDELIFDGRSMFVDAEGRATLVAPSFVEDVRTIETGEKGRPGIYQVQETISAVYEALLLGIRDYLRKTGFQRVLVGLSGGIDSALVCSLAVAALGPENVLGLSMPSPFSSRGSIEDSRQLAANLGIEFRVLPITPAYESFLETFEPHFAGRKPDLTEENIQARIRGNILMAFSNKFGSLLLSTGNKSELAVGYCTLYGDMCGGLSVLADVPKAMVYQLARYINRQGELIPEAIFTKAPSAELRPDQKDQDTLPPYEILDRILYLYIEEGRSTADLIREGFDPPTVEWVTKTVRNSEYKRRQAAPGLKVTTKAFGVGRRMPIAARYKL